MNNNKIIAADCLTTTTDLPVAASDSVLKNVLLSNGGIPSSGGFVILKNNNNNNNIHANSFNHQQQQQQRRRNGNIKNNGLRNNYERKKQSTPIDFENTLSSTLPSKTPILFSSPSPPASLSLSTEIRPPRKFRKNKKNRAGTNPPLSRTTSTTSSTTTITIPLSPSAISTCSLASFATTSSGLSSGASSMGTLNDPDITSIHPCPDNTVIKSSSSSAASSAGFGDMTSNDDEDFHDRSNINFFDEPLILDPIQFSRQWSMPPGGAVEIVNSHSSQILSSPLKSSKSSKRKGNGNGNNGNIKSTKNYPTITNPAIQQFYFEQHQFYRKIYDQQFAVLSATTKPPPSTVSSSTSSPASKDEVLSKSKSFDSQICESNSGSTTTTINNNNNNNGYIPHQHLGLPPLPPPQGYTPWLYPPQTYQLESPENIIPSLCEEAFLAHLKSHQIPKTLPQIASFLLASKKLSTIEIPLISTTSNLNISLPIVSPILPTLPSTPTSSTILLTEKAPQEAIAARADFHKQIRDRLLAASEKRSDPKIQTTPIKKGAKDTDKLKCSLSDAAAIAGVSTPPAPLPQGKLSEDQSLFLQSLPLRRRLPFGSGTSEPLQKTFSSSTTTTTISYASVIQSTPAMLPPPSQQHAPKPTPLNALNLPPLTGYETSTSPPPPKSSPSRHDSSSSSTKKTKKHNGRTFENRLISSSSSSSTTAGGGGGGGKRNNNHNKKNNIEFCMKDNDFPPISVLSITSLTKDLSLSSTQKGESGYQSEFSAQCSTADGETDSRCSEPVHRNYSSVVANGSKSCADLSDSKEDTISLTEDECASVPDDISRMDVLTEHICDYYERVAQTERTLLKKLRLRDMLYYSLAPLFPVCGLYVVGSSLNGFGNENSDMDLCLVITNRELDQRTDAVTVLKMVEQTLSVLPVITEQKLIQAKVPILRIKFNGPYSNVTVDLNANNTVAIKNTHLLCYYAFFDWRLRPLVAIVKEWAKRCNINDASSSSFTSYSLVLMVIHYLQVGIENPVLPSLQNLYSARFNSKNDIRTLNVSLALEDIPAHSTFKRNNDVTLGELLIGFFQYYAHVYDYEKNAISVRLGKSVERKTVIKNRSLTWSPMFIEEPFTHSNTAHSVYDERVFETIKHKFREGYEILSRTSDVNELLNVRPVSVLPSMYMSKVLSS